MTTLPKIDDLDRNLIDALRENPDIRTRDLALTLQASERTVLNRLKKLFEHNILNITYQWNVEEVGFRFNGLVFIDLNNTRLEHALRSLEAIDELIIVSKITSHSDLFVIVLARNVQHFHTILNQVFTLLPRVSIDEILFIAEFVRYPSGIGGPKATAGSWPRLNHFSTELGIDEMDYEIVRLYQTMPVISRRQLAKQLSISETMVKNKVQKLLDKNLIQRAALVSHHAHGNTSHIFICLQTQSSDISALCTIFEQAPETTTIIKTVGRHNLYISLSGSSIETLNNTFHQLLNKHDAEKVKYTIYPFAGGHKYLCSLNFASTPAPIRQ